MKYYNIVKFDEIYEKFIREHSESRGEIEAMLNSDSFEDFCLACNYLDAISYKGNDRLGGYKIVYDLRSLANKRVRDLMGVEAAKLFDSIVKKSKQETWSGDELFKLFSYSDTPYYVRVCIKSMLYATDLMRKGITSIEDCVAVANYIYNPPYGNIYSETIDMNDHDRAKIREKECKAWHKIARYLFSGDIASAIVFLRQECERNK